MNTPLPPRYCFVDAQNIETHYFKEGEKISNKPIRIDHKILYNYLVNNLKVHRDKIFLFYSSRMSGKAKMEFLKGIGFKIIFAKAKREDRDGTEHHNVDTDLIIKSLTSYFEVEDHDLVLVTDDGDFLPLVEFYEQRDAGVILVGTKPGRGGISNKLITKDYTTGEVRDIVYIDNINCLRK